MRLVYVCKYCGKELTDWDVKQMAESDYRVVTEEELATLREARSDKEGPASKWAGRPVISANVISATVRQWRGR
jgi:hypothetical protein